MSSRTGWFDEVATLSTSRDTAPCNASSWIKALENDPKEIRAAAIDAERISDWLMARERERSKDAERTEHEPSGREPGRTREPGEPDWSEAAPVGVPHRGQTGHGGMEPEAARSAPAPEASVGERSRDSGPSR